MGEGSRIKSRQMLEEQVLPWYLKNRRWFRSKARRIQKLRIMDDIALPENGSLSHLLLIEVQYTEGPSEIYLLPVSFASMGKEAEDDELLMEEGMPVKIDLKWLGLKATQIIDEAPQAVIARLNVDEEEGILYDGMYNMGLRCSLLGLIAKRKRINGKLGELHAYPGRICRKLTQEELDSLTSQVLKAEQTNTSVIYAERFFFKLYRKLEEGVNPDAEIVKFLTDKARFPYIPPFAGAIEYRQPGLEPSSVAILQGYAPNQGDAWTYTLDSLSRYFERVLAGRPEMEEDQPASSFLEMDLSTSSPLIQELIGGIYPEMAELLGKRTAELHLALSSAPEVSDFAPEPFSMLYQRSVYQSMRSLAKRVIETLGKNLKKLPENVREEASEVLSSEKEILSRFGKLLKGKLSSMKIRVHGDYHLGQVLFTGKDFIIIDFEGEPARALSERRLKRSPLVDVAGMLRSFHYAAHGALFLHASVRDEDIPTLEPWAELWYHHISSAFLRSYLESFGHAPIVPRNSGEIETLLDAFLLEKAVYELGYELNNRLDWVVIPLRGIKKILRGSVKGE